MYFFLFYSMHPTHPTYCEDEVHYLSNLEAEKLIKSPYYVNNYFKYERANSLVELVFFVTEKNSFYFCPIEDFWLSCIDTFNKLCSDFGFETIQKAFPNENFDRQSLIELESKFYDYTDEIAKAWDKADKIGIYDSEDKKFDRMLDELDRALDNDDDGNWRISDDVG
ncbi:hypothetical protein ACSVH2_08775 [Flavobacterium sp. RSB2_4_14]|uniref:hypothetical protein n=1 Tax=Flavobacterium sp. RSB2_4_14 TaxID=3447665 RepID=UPI003F33E691